MVLSDNGKGWRKYLIAGWAFAECLLFAGILYGWSSLVFVLKDEGIFAHLCDSQPTANTSSADLKLNIHTPSTEGDLYNTLDSSENDKISVGEAGSVHRNVSEYGEVNSDDLISNDVVCKAQDSQMALCFTISSAVFCASCFFMGHVNYKLGTRITRLIAFVIFTAGALCLAFLSKETPGLMYPGLSLIGIGGLPLLVTNTQVSNLFTKGSSSVVGLLCGGYDMSSAVFLVIKIAYQKGLSRRAMYIGLAVLQVMPLISTFLFLPKHFIHRQDQQLNIEIRLHNLSDRSTEPRRNKDRRPSLVDLQPLSSYLKQPLFITHNIWLCLLQLRFYYLIGSLNPYLNRILDGDKALVSYYTNVCFYIMMGGLLTSFLTGIVYDWQKRLFSGMHHCKLYRGLMPAILPLSIATFLSITFSILVLIPVQPLLYVIFIIMTCCRSFMYSMAAAFISAIFPSRYFGLLYGITILNAGIFSCFQYAFFQWAEAYELGATHADIGLLCISVISLGHPIYMWFCARREEQLYLSSLT